MKTTGTGEPSTFVHVLVPRFVEACRGLDVQELLARTGAFEAILARYGSGWQTPAAGEAFFEGAPPWSHSADLSSPLDWGASLRDAVSSELGLEASVGIAATEVAARLAARLAGPRGVLLWMPGREEDLLDGVPLEELDELRPEQVSRLRAAGVTTLDALARLPPSEARALIGVEAEKVVGLVGDSASPPFDLGRSGKPGTACLLLAKRLSRQMDREGVQAQALELTVDYANGVTREQHCHMPRPTGAPEELAEAALRLYRLLPASEAAVVGLSLGAFGFDAPDEPAQLDLFKSRRNREIRVALGRGSAADLHVDSPGG
ncbi:MAG TPA: hypothetical protein VJ921_10105 [Vicinamibacteria bacterium]|nr:hypothetical protein [Vicinamibacteria bacterium]